MNPKNYTNRATVSPSAIAQFYKLQQCPMYLYHRYIDDDFAGISDVSLSPLLAVTGEKFEVEQLQYLLNTRIYSIGPPDSDLSFDERWADENDTNVDRLRTIVGELSNGDRRKPVVFYQPRVEGKVSAWPVRGEADIVIATASGSAPAREVHVRVVELKSSNAVKTHHQLQAAIYSLVFRSILDDFRTKVTASIVSQDPEKGDLASLITSTGDIDLRRLGTFELESRQNDVQLLLEEGGTLDEVLIREDKMRESGEPPMYRIDARCDGCSKQAKCLAYAVTNHNLALLGITEGVQESLRDLGVEDLRDLATLYDWPAEDHLRRSTSHTNPRPRDADLVNTILRETEISNLIDISQIAHRFLRQIDPSFENEWEDYAETAGPWGDYLIGSGRNLPDDNPPENFNLGYPRKSLVRIYPYVQYDFVRNRVVLLAAKVTSTRYEERYNDGLFIISPPKDLPDDTEEAKDREEQRLIETFFNRLSEAINQVRPDLSGEGYSPTEGFLHLYPYGNGQRRALVDAVKRHSSSAAAQALRTLLGYREDIDQEVVSVLRDEFRERHAFRYPGLGLVQTAAQFYSRESKLDWEQPRSNDETPLKTVFALDLFETSVPYRESSARILLNFSNGLQVPSDRMGGYYPVVGRHQEVLPLEYLYATAEFDVIQPEWAKDDETRERIIRYRHHTDENSPRVTMADIEDMIHSICTAYEHIERCIRDKDATVTKEALELTDLTQNTLGVSELQSTCLEYQHLEFGTKRRELEARFRNPLSQRVASGQALPFEVTTAPIEDDEEHHWIEGSLIRSLGGGTDDGVRPDTPISLEPGSFVVMTPLGRDDAGTLTEDVDDPRKIKNKTLGMLTAVDTSSGKLRISLNWITNQSRERFKPNHIGWTSDPDDDYNRQYIEEGMKFVLDAALDDFSAHRAYYALRYATQNDLHNRLVNIYEDEIPNALRVDEPLFDPEALDEFTDEFDEVMPESMNFEQDSFVSQVNHTVSALQGPPGTGKTAYASAPAILSRAYAAPTESFAAVAAAHSNTAVDEIASSVGKSQRRLGDEGVLEDLKLIRIRSSSPATSLPENVLEYHYFDDREELQSLFERYVLQKRSAGPLVVFTTPVTLRNFVNSVRWSIDDDVKSVEEFMADGRSRLFDFVLIDEASMMDLPLLFLIGAFLGVDKQLLLVGDHRQMQPIQSHDWEAEDRQTIEENTPAISALDFARFLRGDEDSNFEQFDRDPPTWSDKEAVLPMDRLKTTYRLPPAMARFETELFYHRDNITLDSGAPPREIPDVRSSSLPEWINAALDPKTRVTLLVHDDNVFTKDSPIEAYLSESLLGPLPVVRNNPREDELTAGIVVPFRLMRRRLQNQFSLTVDTVERFQGGERDVMVLAMTAGNQGYINKLSEFLLDANRFNVGASRMKRKLFIIASKSLFRAVSSDPQKYEQQKAWKQLHQSMVANSSPQAITELTSKEIPELGGRSVTTWVYTGYED